MVVVMLGLLTTILGGWWVGGWVLDFARLKLTQPSLAGAGAELGNIPNNKEKILRFATKKKEGEVISTCLIHFGSLLSSDNGNNAH